MSLVSIFLNDKNEICLSTGEKQTEKRQRAVCQCVKNETGAPDFSDPFPDSFKAFLLDKSITPCNAVFVLPDKFFATDVITVPTFNKRKMMEAVKTEYRKLYKNHGNYATSAICLNSDKSKTSVLFVFTDSERVVSLKRAMTRLKLFNPVVTFEANALNNALFSLRPALKKCDNMFVLPMQNKTLVAFSGNGSTSGFVDIPFGTELCGKKINPFLFKSFPREGFEPAGGGCAKTVAEQDAKETPELFKNTFSDGADLLCDRLRDYLGFYRERTGCNPEEITLLKDIGLDKDKPLFRVIAAEDGEKEFGDLIAYGALNASVFNKELNF